MQKLILGTASFGIPDYGIKHDGQPSIPEIERIANIAWDAGIRIIHGSDEYGLSQEVKDRLEAFQWIWKDKDDPRYFKFGDQLGCSVYNRSEIPAHHDLKIVQMPVNVLTPNLEDIRTLKKTNWEIHARAVFLQGLLLIESIPDWVGREAITMLRTFQIVCKTEGLEVYQAALGYVLGLEEIDKIIIGVNSAHQLEQLLEVKPLKWDYDFTITDENVLDPRRWPKE